MGKSNGSTVQGGTLAEAGGAEAQEIRPGPARILVIGSMNLVTDRITYIAVDHTLQWATGLREGPGPTVTR